MNWVFCLEWPKFKAGPYRYFVQKPLVAYYLMATILSPNFNLFSNLDYH